MRIFIVALTLALFFQTSFLPINLVLLLLVCRSFYNDENSNLIFAVIFGVLLGILSVQNIGVWALLFLLVVQCMHMLKKFPFLTNSFTIIPVSLLVFVSVAFIRQLFMGESMQINLVLLQAFLSLPVYYFVKLWEERFVVHSDIRLKLRN